MSPPSTAGNIGAGSRRPYLLPIAGDREDLRSSSTPILKSWVHQSSVPEMDLGNKIWTIRAISMSLSSSSSSPIENSMKKMYRTLSESDLREVSKPKPKLFSNGYSQVVLEDPEKEEEDMGVTTSLKTLFSSSSLDESMAVGVDEECAGLAGSGGDDICGGGGGGGDEDGGKAWNRENKLGSAEKKK